MPKSTWTRAVACCFVVGCLANLAGGLVAAQEGKKPAAGAATLHDDATINEALIAWRGGNPDKAAEVLRKAAKEKPDTFEYWAYLGRLQLQRGEDGPHIVRYGNQISARPLDDSLDVDQWRKEKLTEALGCFQKMVELQNDYTVAYGYQVICLLGLGRMNDAETTARKAVELEPNDAEWHLQLAAVLRMNAKLDEAGKALEAVEQIAPRRGSLHQERLRVAQAKKEPAEKREELRLRSLFFTYLISPGVSGFTPERGKLVERFGGGRSGIKAPVDVTNEELLAIIAKQTEQPDDFAVDLWLSILHHDNHDSELADAVSRALGAAGSEVNDRLFWVLMNTPESNQTQRRVAKLLATRKDGRILEPLTKFLPYDVDVWPVEAATALGELRDPRAVPALCAVCRGEPPAGQAAVPRTPETEFGQQANRRRCVAALRHFDTPQARETLEQMTADPQMRSTALASLYSLKHDPKLLDEIAVLLSGPKPNFLAVHDLALLEDDAAWQLVLDWGPKSNDEQVRAHTARAIRYAAAAEAQRPMFLATLEKLAQDSSKIVAQEARRGLEKHADKANQLRQLRSFVGRDLRKLDAAEQTEFKKLVGMFFSDVVDEPPLLSYSQFWQLWKARDERGQELLILLQGHPTMTIPGESFATVFVLDSGGTQVSRSHFSAGYRIFINDARLVTEPNIGSPCFEIQSTREFNGDDVGHQYYAVIGGEVALIRLEDSKGNLIRNKVRMARSIGPDFPDRTDDEWERALRSKNRAEVLRTLAWLDGIHRQDLEVLNRPSVRRTLEELAASDDEWLRSAAALALRPLNDRELWDRRTRSK